MRPLRLLAAALCASLLALLAHGAPKAKDGDNTRVSLLDRSSGYHLPTYMMHLYRNFRSNFSRPLDAVEQDAVKQADTVKSLVAKSKYWLSFFLFFFFLDVANVLVINA